MSLLLFFRYFLILLPSLEVSTPQNLPELNTFRIRESTDYLIDDSYFLRVLEDKTSELTFEEVKTKTDDFGYFNIDLLDHESTYWSLFRVRNESDVAIEFLMQLGNNSLLDVYLEDSLGNVSHKKSGYLTPIDQRDILHDGDDKTRLSLEAGEEKTIWIRTQQIDHFKPFLEISLKPYDQWDQEIDRRDLLGGVFTGILTVLAVLGLIFFFYTQERFFMFFGLYALLHALYFFSFYGYVSIYFFPANPALTQPFLVLQIIIFATYFGFARTFLRTKDFMPEWNKIFKLTIPILVSTFIVVMMFLLLTLNLRDAIRIKNGITLICSFGGLIFLVALLRSGRVEAKYFAAGSVMLLSMLCYISINFFFSQEAYNPLLIQIGILVELVIFSMGIGYQARNNQNENRITQDSLILQFRENEKMQKGINQKLEESVAERTHKINQQNKEIQKAREIAEKATVAKSEFLSVMSHEIRTPLNAIISLTHLMELENENPENQEYIDALKFSGESLHSLINDVLDYSKIEAGKLKLESVDFSIVDLLNKISASFKFKAQAKNIDLNLEIGEYTPDRLLGDPTRLTQIINNLISNAIKFTNEGGVTVKTYLVGIKDEIATIGFEVSDTGIGIPQDKLKDIFEDYEQASRETTRQYGGTGLGLAITKKLLELHGAEIKIASTEKIGTTFKFEIDFRIDSKFEVFEPQTGYGTKDNLKGAKILVVDDNDMNRLVLKRLFKKWNAEYYESSSGRESCDLVNEAKFDLILMDIEMADMDGYETARHIKSTANLNQGTLIIAMSARNDLEARTKATNSHMNEFIRKPFDPEILFNKINISLKRSDDEEN